MLIRLLVLAAFGLATVAPASADGQRRTRPAPDRRSVAQQRAALEQALLEASGIYPAIRRNFPAEYEGLAGRIVGIAMAHRQNPPAGWVLISQEMSAFQRTTLAPNLANAPSDLLLRVIRIRVDLFEAAQRLNPALCGQVGLHGNPGGALPQGLAALNPMMEAMTVAMIEAAGGGRRTPVADRGSFSEEEVAAWEEAVARLDPQGDLSPLIGNAPAQEAAAPERQCRYIIAMYRSMGLLPPDLGGKAAAWWMGEQIESLRRRGQ